MSQIAKFSLTNLIRIGLLLTSLSAVGYAHAEGGHYGWGHHNGAKGIAGAYNAKLDLNPLGIKRIEAMSLILHRNGTVSFASEHEPNDLSTSGIGVWQRIAKRKIAIGLHIYRMGFEGVCQFVAVTEPDNCVLQLGATLTRKRNGNLNGMMLLTVVGPDDKPAVAPIPAALTFTMEPMRLEDFRGTSPADYVD